MSANLPGNRPRVGESPEPSRQHNGSVAVICDGELTTAHCHACRSQANVARAGQKVVLSELANQRGEEVMAKTIARRRRVVRRDWTRAEVKELRQHSRDKTRVKTISRALKRTPGALRQKARALGIPLGHRRTKKKRA